MAGEVDSGASGDIALAIQRRKGDIAVPVYLWSGTAWVDFQALTPAQFSAWVDFRCSGIPIEVAGDPNHPPVKRANLTMSRTNDW